MIGIADDLSRLESLSDDALRELTTLRLREHEARRHYDGGSRLHRTSAAEERCRCCWIEMRRRWPQAAAAEWAAARAAANQEPTTRGGDNGY
jgi:hypothetical protein